MFFFNNKIFSIGQEKDVLITVSGGTECFNCFIWVRMGGGVGGGGVGVGGGGGGSGGVLS
jgi:hypothetical protein